MSTGNSESFKSVLQLLAIVCLIALLSMVAHKATVDITILAEKHSGSEFWTALVRYLLGNLAGGKEAS
jgi:hypothetical protein